MIQAKLSEMSPRPERRSRPSLATQSAHHIAESRFHFRRPRLEPAFWLSLHEAHEVSYSAITEEVHRYRAESSFAKRHTPRFRSLYPCNAHAHLGHEQFVDTRTRRFRICSAVPRTKHVEPVSHILIYRRK